MINGNVTTYTESGGHIRGGIAAAVAILILTKGKAVTLSPAFGSLGMEVVDDEEYD
ncbi:MAG: hypothetical protein FWE02_00875 [Defluviitaleaceae bacterium]|nr:hypothetical protein [Defluviitaleaceae bacterium]